MITLSYDTVRKDRNFGQALSKLGSCRNFRPKVAYDIGKVIRKIESENKNANELWNKVLAKYCELDDKGAPKQENGMFKLKTDAASEFEKEAKEFFALTFTIDWNKINLMDLEAVKDPALTPDEIMSLEPLIDETKPTLNVAPLE